MIHRFSENVLVKAAFNAVITAATVNGAGVDTQTYRHAAAIFNTAPSGAGTTSDCKLQESPDNAAWADVAGATFTQGATGAGSTVQLLDVDLAKRQRYLRLVHTGAGGSAAGQATGTFVLFDGQLLAPAQDVAARSV